MILVYCISPRFIMSYCRRSDSAEDMSTTQHAIVLVLDALIGTLLLSLLVDVILWYLRGLRSNFLSSFNMSEDENTQKYSEESNDDQNKESDDRNKEDNVSQDAQESNMADEDRGSDDQVEPHVIPDNANREDDSDDMDDWEHLEPITSEDEFGTDDSKDEDYVDHTNDNSMIVVPSRALRSRRVAETCQVVEYARYDKIDTNYPYAPFKIVQDE